MLLNVVVQNWFGSAEHKVDERNLILFKSLVIVIYEVFKQSVETSTTSGGVFSLLVCCFFTNASTPLSKLRSVDKRQNQKSQKGKQYRSLLGVVTNTINDEPF